MVNNQNERFTHTQAPRRTMPMPRQEMREYPYPQQFPQGGQHPGFFPTPTPPQNSGSLFDLFSGGAGGQSGKFNLSDVKAMVDRMGGIDGIMTSLQKMNKIVQTMQQMAPMLKLMFGSLSPKGKALDVEDSYESDRPRKRRRINKRPSTARRRTRRRRHY